MSEFGVLQIDPPAQPRWARLPNKWIMDSGLLFFRGGGDRGISMAALKLYVAILLHAENRAEKSAGPHQGSAALTYNELSSMTDLSRGMVAAGVQKLKHGEFLTVVPEGQGRKSRYFLSDYKAGFTFGKLPVQKIWAGGLVSNEMRLLHELASRRDTDFQALKLYLLLCAYWDRRTGATMISYEGINLRSGLPEAKIRSALSVLYEHRLVRRIEEKAITDTKVNPPNRYEILGL